MKGKLIEYLKEIFKIIKANLLLLFGVGLFTYNLFDFHIDRYCDEEGGLLPKLPSIGENACHNPSVFYYYDNLTLILLVIGAILITIGVLKIRKENHEGKN